MRMRRTSILGLAAGTSLLLAGYAAARGGVPWPGISSTTPPPAHQHPGHPGDGWGNPWSRGNPWSHGNPWSPWPPEPSGFNGHGFAPPSVGHGSGPGHSGDEDTGFGHSGPGFSQGGFSFGDGFGYSRGF